MTEILILDYNREGELKNLLLSLRENAQFEKKVVVLNNGGENYADKFLEEGLCDKIINNKVNVGCGAGTIQLFSQCQSEFAFYIQCDHKLNTLFTDSVISFFERLIKECGYFYVDLAGDQGRGAYSERAQFIRKEDYLLIPKESGGPGPLQDLKWTEECVQDYIKENNLKFYSVLVENNNRSIPPFTDCGWSSVRENPDKSVWSHCPDTKVLKCLKQPTEKFSFPPFNNLEWNIALAGQWPTLGAIPESWKEHSFEFWNKLDNEL